MAQLNVSFLQEAKKSLAGLKKPLLKKLDEVTEEGIRSPFPSIEVLDMLVSNVSSTEEKEEEERRHFFFCRTINNSRKERQPMIYLEKNKHIVALPHRDPNLNI